MCSALLFGLNCRSLLGTVLELQLVANWSRGRLRGARHRRGGGSEHCSSTGKGKICCLYLCSAPTDALKWAVGITTARQGFIRPEHPNGLLIRRATRAAKERFP